MPMIKTREVIKITESDVKRWSEAFVPAILDDVDIWPGQVMSLGLEGESVPGWLGSKLPPWAG